MATNKTVATRDDNSELARQYAPLIDNLPLAADDNGDGIILGILSANSWEDLNDESKLPAGRDMIGRGAIKVTEVCRRESDLAESESALVSTDGRRWYLDVKGTIRGEAVHFHTGAGSPAAKLIKLTLEGWLPAVVEFSESSKATKAGYRPLNLSVISADGAGF